MLPVSVMQQVMSLSNSYNKMNQTQEPNNFWELLKYVAILALNALSHLTMETIIQWVTLCATVFYAINQFLMMRKSFRKPKTVHNDKESKPEP
jgi:hypothetical protein